MSDDLTPPHWGAPMNKDDYPWLAEKAQLEAHIAALEAEVARLREALE